MIKYSWKGAKKMIQQYSIKKQFLNHIVHKDYYSFLKKELNKYYQHGKTTIFVHVRNVSFASYKVASFLNSKFKANIDLETLITSAYMHDLFMYDWHEKSTTHRLHGYTHPKVAAENAKKYCNATEKMQKIIKTHMWPLTITKIPTSKEAWILCICDKHVALKETIFRH